MNESQFGNKVRLALNQGLRVHPDIAARLKAARERALERRQVETVPARALAGDTGAQGGVIGTSVRWLIPAAVLVASLVGAYTWQQNLRAVEIEEIDAEMLIGDLPIDAYLDKGFEAWLAKREGR